MPIKAAVRFPIEEGKQLERRPAGIDGPADGVDMREDEVDGILCEIIE